MSLQPTGIFATEPGQRLLLMLLKLADRAFHQLFTRCNGEVKSVYYQNGLCRAETWSETLIDEDVEFVKTLYPDMDETFEFCVKQYVLERFRGTQSTPALSKSEFVRSFYKSLGQHEALTSGVYFSRGEEVSRRIACMDSGRDALYSLIYYIPTTSVELASQVATEELHPDDSISQIGSARAPGYDAREETYDAPSVVSKHSPRRGAPASVVSTRRDASTETHAPRDAASVVSRASRSRDVSAEAHVPRDAASVVSETRRRAPEKPSRHDVVHDSEEFSRSRATSVASESRYDGFEIVPKPPERQVASSRDSHVSVGMRTIRSPRR